MRHEKGVSQGDYSPPSPLLLLLVVYSLTFCLPLSCQLHSLPLHQCFKPRVHLCVSFLLLCPPVSCHLAKWKRAIGDFLLSSPFHLSIFTHTNKEISQMHREIDSLESKHEFSFRRSLFLSFRLL